MRTQRHDYQEFYAIFFPLEIPDNTYVFADDDWQSNSRCLQRTRNAITVYRHWGVYYRYQRLRLNSVLRVNGKSHQHLFFLLLLFIVSYYDYNFFFLIDSVCKFQEKQRDGQLNDCQGVDEISRTADRTVSTIRRKAMIKIIKALQSRDMETLRDRLDAFSDSRRRGKESMTRINRRHSNCRYFRIIENTKEKRAKWITGNPIEKSSKRFWIKKKKKGKITTFVKSH